MFAQTGDLSVRFDSESRVTSPDRCRYVVRVGWNGAEPARDLTLSLNVQGTVLEVNSLGEDRWQCTNANPIRCTTPAYSRTNDLGGISVTVKFPGPGTYAATASVSTLTSEAPSSNNVATHSLDVTGLPSLLPRLTWRDDNVDPGGIGIVDLSVSNYGDAATNIVMRGRIEGGEILTAEPLEWGHGPPASACTIQNGEAACTIPAMRPFYDFELVRLTYRAPDRREGGKVVGIASVTSDKPNFEPAYDTTRTELTLRRMFTVTSADDSGPGTLRQAILESASACENTPCTIAFEGVQFVQPQSALPELRGVTRVTGRDARVTLDGSLLAAGHGLAFDGCGFEVRNLHIRDFPGHGIEARERAEGNCGFFGVGVFVNRTEISGTERGIVAKGIDASLKENFIHTQRRAGIFIDGSYYSEIFNNVVVDNGASGIFVNTSTTPRYGGIPPGADIVENVVHGNGEWGIVRTRNGLVQIRRNSTVRNGLFGVDVGLDLSTPNREDDRSGIPNKPVLESATYDPDTNTTIIRGTEEWGARIDLYASTSLSRYGHPESEIYLGEQWVYSDGRINMRVPGDLRGMWITATKTKSHTLYFLIDQDAKPQPNVWRPPTGYDTSELSDPVQVQ